MSVGPLLFDMPVLALVLIFLRARVLLPSGPRSLPVLGNVLGLNPNKPWITYADWAKVHGDLVYSRLLNQEIIVFNSEKVAKDLLERRANNYSDRPQFIIIALFGGSFNSALLNYGNRWRLHRRLFQQAFRADAAMIYRPTQLRKVHQLLANLLETPGEYSDHLQMLSTAVIMAVAYGYDPASRHDPLVMAVERTANMLAKASTPEGAAVLSVFPFSDFKRKALECQELTVNVIEAPFQYVKQNIAAGTAKPSMVSDLLSRMKADDDSYELAIKHTSASAFLGKHFRSYTASALKIFMLAMFLYPDVQRKAWLEIDSVVGQNRLPDFNDRPSLPYIEAILRETFRWHPGVPLGVSHATMNDDHFGGYFIPKGAIVMANIWAMSHNEDKYPDSDEFKPERFFMPDGKLNNDNVSFVFGFGRRVCIGRHIADATVWAAIVSILAAFSITKAKDEQGNDIEVSPQCHPLPYPCRIEPRSGMSSEKLMQMINSHK
ncbi:hypothetical protein SERLA73DRAFT_119400 [Serpula lacrymans var. lacrymans S7.3]|uniref:Cytochrome P450 n=2 Tax=Serpula lacrymans var. lacrymans TaxID=341189 RepID=F8PJC5_SERL3|nr:uncharacterized protein SERLADRAFT_365613 [Serpula lacrymans var. lacrymans S7.9]EGO03750.1 hypothetical protein SERLA73DRAFT_119400 [Serpula lacrymans var. lacrymans S7.3]EGO29617.1 hypothetical protein SERLADRAFT_365613 [Serpula lacrymans var. lacrymans S7.9]